MRLPSGPKEVDPPALLLAFPTREMLRSTERMDASPSHASAT